MKKLCLIENLSFRQKEHISYLTEYEDILDNIVDNKYDRFYTNMLAGKLDLDYEIVMIHESAFDPENNRKFLKLITKYCRDNKKELVIFSGGVAFNTYLKELDRLELKSSTFYLHLNEFLKAQRDGNNNLLILAYGEKWKESLYMEIQQKLKDFIRVNRDKADNVFSSRLVYSNVDLNLLPPEIGTIPENLKLEDLTEINTKLIEYISEM